MRQHRDSVQDVRGAVVQLNCGGDAIVLDSGGYGPVTITQSVRIEAPPGVLAFIHPPSGDAVTVNAPGASVKLRGLTLNAGTNNGITVAAVGTLNVENCVVTGFAFAGIYMGVAGHLNVLYTDAKGNGVGLVAANNDALPVSVTSATVISTRTSGLHRDAGSSSTSVTTPRTRRRTTTRRRDGSSEPERALEVDTLNLESCTASQNGSFGIEGFSANAASRVRFSNCTLSKNGQYASERFQSGLFESRGNSSVTGNGTGPANGAIGSHSPM